MGVAREPLLFPGGDVRQCTRVPPQRHRPWLASLRTAVTDPDMRPWQFSSDIIDAEHGNFTRPQTAAAGQAEDDQIEPRILRPRRLSVQFGEYNSYLSARQNL